MHVTLLSPLILRDGDGNEAQWKRGIAESREIVTRFQGYTLPTLLRHRFLQRFTDTSAVPGILILLIVIDPLQSSSSNCHLGSRKPDFR